VKALQNRDREGAARDGAAREGAVRDSAPAAYLITWVCYGAWLPGQAGAISRTQNRFGTPIPEPDIRKERRAKAHMTQEPYLLDEIRRQRVLQSLIEVCSCRGYSLLAAHVRTNHIHVVIAAACKPERVMNAMKAYGSRALNQHGLERPGRRRWARHGSTRYLWTEDDVRGAIEYVVRRQGEPMAVFETFPSLTLRVPTAMEPRP